MKVNPHLDKIYREPVEKQVKRVQQEQKKAVNNSLIIWYDSMTVNPLWSYFTPDDVQEINRIAHSPSLMTKPKEKYELLGEIMARRGFYNPKGGTNRRTYFCAYDNRIVAKIATDEVGQTSNLKEFVNQHVLKPYCSKVFEVTPCGTLAIAERVVPVSTYDEFVDICEDVAMVLVYKIRAKNIAMEDIGAKSFKNWGIRVNFGPVILDYPTMYVLDTKKAYCTARDRFGRYCDGRLDYDDGFDHIICQKCGKQYLSKAIARKDGDSIDALLKAQGILNLEVENNMKISFDMYDENGTKVEVVNDMDNGRSSTIIRQGKSTYPAPKDEGKPTRLQRMAKMFEQKDIKLPDPCVSFTPPQILNEKTQKENLIDDKLSKYRPSESISKDINKPKIKNKKRLSDDDVKLIIPSAEEMYRQLEFLFTKEGTPEKDSEIHEIFYSIFRKRYPLPKESVHYSEHREPPTFEEFVNDRESGKNLIKLLMMDIKDADKYLTNLMYHMNQDRVDAEIIALRGQDTMVYSGKMIANSIEIGKQCINVLDDLGRMMRAINPASVDKFFEECKMENYDPDVDPVQIHVYGSLHEVIDLRNIKLKIDKTSDDEKKYEEIKRYAEEHGVSLDEASEDIERASEFIKNSHVYDTDEENEEPIKVRPVYDYDAFDGMQGF